MNAALTFSTVIVQFRSFWFYLASVVLKGGGHGGINLCITWHVPSCVFDHSCENVHFYHFDGSCFCKAVNTSHMSFVSFISPCMFYVLSADAWEWKRSLIWEIDWQSLISACSICKCVCLFLMINFIRIFLTSNLFTFCMQWRKKESVFFLVQ